jgi:hypothetical protein
MVLPFISPGSMSLKSFAFMFIFCKYSACFQIFKNSSGHEPKNLLQEEA